MPIYPYQKNNKEHYYYAFEVKDSFGRRKTLKKRGFTTKTSCKHAEAEARTEWEKGDYIDLSNITFGDYISDWLTNKQDISPETRANNVGHIKNHVAPSIGSIKLQDIKVDHIKKMLKEMNQKDLASGTVKKIYNLVNTCLSAAKRERTIKENPIELLDKGLKPKIQKRDQDFWTREEVKLFFLRLKETKDQRQSRYDIVFRIAIFAGMRRGEIFGLRWQDIDFQNNRIYISQTLTGSGRIKKGAKNDNSNRVISITSKMSEILSEHKKVIDAEKQNNPHYEDNNLVVATKNGKKFHMPNFTSKFWKPTIEVTGVKEIKFHELRHTCASLMILVGVHPKAVQEILGHKSITITLDYYSHLMPSMQSEGVQKLENFIDED